MGLVSGAWLGLRDVFDALWYAPLAIPLFYVAYRVTKK